MAKVVVIFDYDEELLEKEGQTFEGELGWLEQSGIIPKDVIYIETEEE